MAHVQGTGGGEDLHGEHALQAVDAAAQLAAGGPAQGDVVFLHRGRRDRVGGGGHSVALELAHDAGLRVLGDHVAGVHARVAGEEGVEAAVAGGVEEAVGAPFANRRQVSHDNRQKVQHAGHRCAVEVAVGGHAAVLGHHGVVVGGGELPVGHGGHVCQRVAESAGDLRGAADGVGVLDVVGLEAVQGGGEDRRVRGDGADVVSGNRLARVGTQLLQVLVEDGQGACQALDAHGGGDVGDLGGLAQVRDGQAQHAEHAVGAVDQRQALLFAQHQRLDAGSRKRLSRRDDLAAADADFALAEQRQRAVRQRRQVAGAAERAVLAHHRGDPGVERGGVGLRHHGAHAGAAGAQRGQAQKHQSADDLLFHLRAGARGVGADQGDLQLGAHVLRDVLGGQRAEAGGDAVDRGRVCGEFLDALAGRGDLIQSRLVDGDLGSVAGDGHNVVDGQGPDSN